MARQRAAASPLPPLFVWNERKRIGELERQRDGLKTRMQRMPPRSRRRLHAESEIAVLTRQILAAEVSLERSTLQ